MSSPCLGVQPEGWWIPSPAWSSLSPVGLGLVGEGTAWSGTGITLGFWLVLPHEDAPAAPKIELWQYLGGLSWNKASGAPGSDSQAPLLLDTAALSCEVGSHWPWTRSSMKWGPGAWDNQSDTAEQENIKIMHLVMCSSKSQSAACWSSGMAGTRSLIGQGCPPCLLLPRTEFCMPALSSS